ncbi:YlqD family protein [Halobacillus sp. ACCC02827]|uniref:YlqD family protein n=1 Tax=Bacillaceae TaxID=186817 RepID=UPI0002A51FB4|nr:MULTISPECIES: YlqD family protein [Bacillaceae]ELK45744.1 hypothetical protein D479_13507 [Halobacillus sp. BAB-2008]QHT46634.1 hypothetical protein M662_09075 [Bacillus sp. SB49]WJE17447.1 YlqD family protein [Halobacillus sp. ACCC02827]
MQIIRRVPVKEVLTNNSRAEMKRNFDQKWKQLDQECEQLMFEQKKLERKPGLSKQEVEKRFSKEISRRKDQLRWLEYQSTQLDILPDGSELKTDEVDVLVTVHEGDCWKDITQEQEIVIKDGKVIRAR